MSEDKIPDRPPHHKPHPDVPDFVWKWTGAKAKLRDMLLAMDEDTRKEAASILLRAPRAWRDQSHQVRRHPGSYRPRN